MLLKLRFLDTELKDYSDMEDLKRPDSVVEFAGLVGWFFMAQGP